MFSPCETVNEPQVWMDGSGVRGLKRPLMTIRDESGGMLRLDLAQPGMDEMAQACKALLESTLSPGICLIRVLAGDDIFRLRHVTRAPFRLGITRMNAQAREITIPKNVLRQVIRILDNTEHLRAPFSAFRSSLISYTL